MDKTQLHELYRLALTADRNWSAELRKCFGDRASEVRYISLGRGLENSRLRSLYLEFRYASEVYLNACAEYRQSSPNNPAVASV